MRSLPRSCYRKNMWRWCLAMPLAPVGEGFVRCSYATAYEKIEEALVRMERFMRRQG